MIRLTVFGGAGEIGGNKILLEDGAARLLLDFGVSFSRRSRFFEEYLAPRAAAGLADLTVTGVLPSVRGLYRLDLLRMGGPGVPPPHETPAADALLLSHAHLDHAGHLGFLDERIPTYCSPLCHKTLVALTGSRGRDFESELVDFRPRPAFPDARDVVVPRRFELVEGSFEAGGLACQALPVDHSMLGCVAFLIRTSRGNVLYTGDLRFHGPARAHSEAMLETARTAGVWLLIPEGTRLGVTEQRTESDVYAECLDAVHTTRGSVIADFGPRDLYRLNTFLQIALETNRELVILPQDAFLLEALRGLDPAVPDPRQPPIVILKERKMSGTYSEKDYQRWERSVLTFPTVRTAGDLARMRDRLILAFGFWDILNLVDLGVGPDTLYIRSSSEAYSEEQLLDEHRLDNWLALLGVARRMQSHASGHAPQPDLLRLVRTVQPEIVIPVHTEQPDLWREMLPGARVVVPEPGAAMVF
jgi:ribonuclease J